MRYQKPELYYDEKGNPKGYRVGISGGIYGTCPFCGKSYTEEDIKCGDVNFEHLFSRFAVKRAIDEKKVFPKIESEFMVAVHQLCNSHYGAELEKNISGIINNINKPRVQLTKEGASILMNYCIKVSVFLRYLFLWDNINKQTCYKDERIEQQHHSACNLGTRFYELFNVRIRYVDSSAGLWWGLNMPGEEATYCFSIVLNDIEISFYPMTFDDKYKAKEAVFINRFIDELILLYGNENITFPFCLDKKYRMRKSLPWSMKKVFSPSYRMYNNHIKTLTGFFDDMFGLSKNYFNLQRKLSIMPQDKLEKIGVLSDCYKGIVFCRNKQLYFVDFDGVVQNMASLPYNAEIPAFCFQQFSLAHLPNISKLKIVGDIRIIGGDLESLDGCPQFVQGHVFVRGNKLKSLQGAPKEIGGIFSFDAENLESLDGLPKAQSYCPSECYRCFDSVDELKVWFKRYKKEQTKTKIKELQKGTKVVSTMDTVTTFKENMRLDDQYEV